MICPRKNNLCVDSCLDAALDAPEIAEMALRAQADGADAVCLYCFSDPGFDACRELLHVPVVGGAQAAVLLASQLALGFSVLTTSARRIPQKKLSPRAGRRSRQDRERARRRTAAGRLAGTERNH